MSPLQCIADSGPCGSLLVGTADQNWGWILLETVDQGGYIEELSTCFLDSALLKSSEFVLSET